MPRRRPTSVPLEVPGRWSEAPTETGCGEGAREDHLWVALVGCTVGATEARAFVWETTGYTSGTPLAWSSRCVVIAVPDPRSSMVTWDDLLTATAAAAERVECGGGRLRSRSPFRRPEGASKRAGRRERAVNADPFRTNDYCAGRSGCDPASPAITWFYDVHRAGAGDDGRVLETDTEINAQSYGWGVNGAPGVMGLETVLTYQLGHGARPGLRGYQSGFGLPRPIDDRLPSPPLWDTAPASVKASVMYPQRSFVGYSGRYPMMTSGASAPFIRAKHGPNARGTWRPAADARSPAGVRASTGALAIGLVGPDLRRRASAWCANPSRAVTSTARGKLAGALAIPRSLRRWRRRGRSAARTPARTSLRPARCASRAGCSSWVTTKYRRPIRESSSCRRRAPGSPAAVLHR